MIRLPLLVMSVAALAACASVPGRPSMADSRSDSTVPAGRRCRPSVARQSVLQGDTIVSGEAPLLYARLRPTPKVPRYPADEKRNNIEGRVLASFVVDTLGRVVPGSEVITQETGRGFGDAVCSYLRGVRFVPYERDGRHLSIELRDQLTTFSLTR